VKVENGLIVEGDHDIHVLLSSRSGTTFYSHRYYKSGLRKILCSAGDFGKILTVQDKIKFNTQN